jgi:hypothetical protein
MSTLYNYRVTLDWQGEEGFYFDCQAEDDIHAIEQTSNAYPECAIIYAENLGEVKWIKE